MDTVFDPLVAASYGAFVDAAYAMYASDTSNPHPAPNLGTIAKYEVFAYITMRDFVVSAGDQSPSFYGFIAAKSDGSQYVLALRGTDDFIEFFADLHVGEAAFSVVPNSGHVVVGFSEIYQTMQVDLVASFDADGKLDKSASFGAQVTRAVHAHHRAIETKSSHTISARALPVELPPQLVIAGHSLGAALATLFVMESAYRNSTLATGAPKYLRTPGVYTFGSPATGNAAFVARYATFGATQGIQTWRIVNKADFVPNLPPALLGWQQVGDEQLYDSHDNVLTLRRAHLMSTYEQLLRAAAAPSA